LLLAGNQSVSIAYRQWFHGDRRQLHALPRPADPDLETRSFLPHSYVIAWVALERHPVGRRILAIGDGEATAKLMGLKVERTLIGVYMFSGLMAGTAGVILASSNFAGQPTEGVGWELIAIASVVVGGTLLTGGVGSIGATLRRRAAARPGVQRHQFRERQGWISLSSAWQPVIRGLFLLAVVILQAKTRGSRAMPDAGLDISAASPSSSPAPARASAAPSRPCSPRAARRSRRAQPAPPMISRRSLKPRPAAAPSRSTWPMRRPRAPQRAVGDAGRPSGQLRRLHHPGIRARRPVESFDSLIAVNTRAPLIVTQEYARDRIASGVGGAVVNVSSNSSMKGFVDHAAYCASKGALDAMSRVMANELGRHGIRVNCVNPG
jgi:hypothetical protein